VRMGDNSTNCEIRQCDRRDKAVMTPSQTNSGNERSADVGWILESGSLSGTTHIWKCSSHIWAMVTQVPQLEVVS
jgi:hypothetical protein